MSDKQYRFSFTAANALIFETLVIAKKYFEYGDWNLTQQDVLGNNLLQKEKQATAKRQFAELKMRVDTLSKRQLELLCTSNMDDVKAMIWLSIVKTYSFIEDFVLEVVLDEYYNGGRTITNADYYNFLEFKKIQHTELTRLSDMTISKIEQVLFRVMEQVGIIESTKNRMIIKPVLSARVEMVITEDNPRLLNMFLYETFHIKRLIEKGVK